MSNSRKPKERKGVPAKHGKVKRTTGPEFGDHRVMTRFLVLASSTSLVNVFHDRELPAPVADLLETDNSSCTEAIMTNNPAIQS